MRLSQLKDINLEAYNLFIEEMEFHFTKEYISLLLKDDCNLQFCINWASLRQGPFVWRKIYLYKDFSDLNIWLDLHKKQNNV